MERGLPTPNLAKARFVEAVSNFKEWAASLPNDQLSAEWEADYDEWSGLTTEFCQYLDAVGSSELSDHMKELLIYIVARDNEMEVLKDELVRRPDHLIPLAKAASTSCERDARWQFADALGSVEAYGQDVESLIEHFLRDEDEYVSRRALSALARRRSANTDTWAVRAWETGDEYQRMAALDAFAETESPKLLFYLDQAQIDGRRYLVGFAKELRDRHSQ